MPMYGERGHARSQAAPAPLLPRRRTRETVGRASSSCRRRAPATGGGSSREATRDGSLPYVRLGRYRRYDRGDVLAWVEAQKASGHAAGVPDAGSGTRRTVQRRACVHASSCV